jgi:hypothetical protein
MLTTMAQIKCMHGGTVMIIPKPNLLTIEGQFALLTGDLMGSVIVGCPVVPSPSSKPCTTVVMEPMNWGSPFITVMGRQPFTFMPGMPGGLTDGVPPGPLMCYAAGQTCAA